MSSSDGPSIGFWRTVRLLVDAAQTRAVARYAQLNQIKEQQTRDTRPPSAFHAIGAVLMIAVIGAFVHGIFALLIASAVQLSVYHQLEADGQLLVSKEFIAAAATESDAEARKKWIGKEADIRTRALGGMRDRRFDEIQAQLETRGATGFVASDQALQLPLKRQSYYSESDLTLSVALAIVVIWFWMLALQGEGVEFDVQRRRHPHWEWLLSHPIRPSAVFAAEILSPFAANPFLITAPLFCIAGLSAIHGVGMALLIGTVIGLSWALAASACAKAIEVVCMLRLSAQPERHPGHAELAGTLLDDRCTLRAGLAAAADAIRAMGRSRL